VTFFLLEGKYGGLFIKRNALSSDLTKKIHRSYIFFKIEHQSGKKKIIYENNDAHSTASRETPWVRERPNYKHCEVL
jgi:hypothetical protein